MKAKHQRLVLILIAFVALLAAVLIAAYALRDQAAYFYTPSDIKEQGVEVGKAIRLGGMVQTGSIQTEADGVTINFIVNDGKAQTPVKFRGITPDLFVEGSGVVAEGRMTVGGYFAADNLLAKHDENYMPRELQDMDMDETQKLAETVTQ